MNNKELYERLLVAKAISKVMGTTVVDAFNFVQKSSDVETADYVWIKIAGNSISWGDNLLYIIAEILDINIAQPGYEPFSVTEETLDSDPKYKKWYTEVWSPYLADLIVKYSDVFAPRLKTKIERGNKDWIQKISEEYHVNLG